MKKIVSLLLLTLSIMLLNGCVPKENINIKTYTDPKANLAGYKTYDWLVGANILVDNKKQWVGRGYDINHYVEMQITDQLLAKGKNRNLHTPDFLISYVVGVNMDSMKEKTDENGIKYFKNIPEGGIGIVLLDTRTKQVIWASNADATVQSKLAVEDSKKRIAYAIEQMFTRF